MKRILRNVSKKILALLVLIAVVVSGTVIVSAEGETFDILGGENYHVIGSCDDAVLICSGALENFLSFSINNEIVDKANYTAEKYGLGEGSTLLKIKAEYLNVLSDEENTYKGSIDYTNGTKDFHFYFCRDGRRPAMPYPGLGYTEVQTIDNDKVIIKLSGKLGSLSDLYDIRFQDVSDYKSIEKANYTLEEKEDSILLTLNQNYLKTIAFNSRVNLSIQFYNGKIGIDCDFNINGSNNSNSGTTHTFYQITPNCIIKDGYYGMTEISTGLSSDQIINISIDGNVLDESLYTINDQENTTNTIVFDLEYLKELSIGQHTISADYVNDNSKNETRTATFKIEEPLKFPQSSNQCSPECQAQIDELKSQVKTLQEQLTSLQSQVTQLQGNINSGDNNNNNGDSSNNTPIIPDNSDNVNNDNNNNTGNNSNNVNDPSGSNNDSNNSNNTNNNTNSNNGSNNINNPSTTDNNNNNSLPGISNNNAQATQTIAPSNTPARANITNTNVPIVNSSNTINTENKSVKTGDELKVFMIVLVFLCSSCGIVICVRNIKNIMK